MAQRITWTNEKRKLSQLVPWPRNPRQIKDAQVRRLQESREEFGQPEPILIGPDNELYNGHQRLKSWIPKFGDIEVDVRVSSRPLTEKEREKLTIYLHKGATGEFDFDILANEFEIDELLEWGFAEYELGLDTTVIGFQPMENESREASVWNKMSSDAQFRKFEFGEFRLLIPASIHDALWEYAGGIEDKTTAIAEIIEKGLLHVKNLAD